MPQLIRFEGINSNKKISLNWEYASTLDLNHCILERSENAKEFQPIANFLLTEKLANTFFDYSDQPSENGNYKYRLKSIGKFGEVKYSTILAFQIRDKEHIQQLEVYPTFITDHFNLRFNSEIGQPGLLEIIDYSGKPVYQQKLNLQKGINKLSVNNLITARGNLIIVLKAGDRYYNQKIIVQ